MQGHFAHLIRLFRSGLGVVLFLQTFLAVCLYCLCRQGTESYRVNVLDILRKRELLFFLSMFRHI